jgi:SAM-dependent methyltransferase
MHSASDSWSDYYGAVATRPPRDTLLKALALFDNGPLENGFAIDLGCGAGADTREMLRRGWRVLAIDREADAIQRVLAGMPHGAEARLQTWLAAFEDLTSLPECDLVNASYSLPFCPPANFEGLWRCIVSAIRPRGRFSGTLFGDHDGWVGTDSMTFHSQDNVDALMRPFHVEMLIEEDRDVSTALGQTKHWHTFQIVARKR